VPARRSRWSGQRVKERLRVLQTGPIEAFREPCVHGSVYIGNVLSAVTITRFGRYAGPVPDESGCLKAVTANWPMLLRRYLPPADLAGRNPPVLIRHERACLQKCPVLLGFPRRRLDLVAVVVAVAPE
jgi:hypothetical protein